MGSVVSNMYDGVQYVLGCGGDKQSPTNGGTISRASPFVWKRTSSMYFDEDGDLAHEFYEEVKPRKKGKKAWMKRVTRRLLPQGPVDLPHPQLHVDFPVVMCEAY